VGGILKQMSNLFDRSFETSTDLNRYRKELIARLAATAAAATAASPALVLPRAA